MKKAILIYLIGVVLGWNMTYNILEKWNVKYHRKTTYGDVALASSLSLLSWCDVIAMCIFEIKKSDFWDKPVNETTTTK